MIRSRNTRLHIGNSAITANFMLGLVELTSLPGDHAGAGDIVIFIVYFIDG